MSKSSETERSNMNKDLLILTGLILIIVNYQVHEEGFTGWVLMYTFLFSIIPILIALLLKIRFNEIGLSLESWKKFLPVSLVILFLSSPFIVYASTRGDFSNYYPIWNPGLPHLNFLMIESIVLLLMFNTEFFFRATFFSVWKRDLVTGPSFFNPYHIPSCISESLLLKCHIPFSQAWFLDILPSNTGRSSQAY